MVVAADPPDLPGVGLTEDQQAAVVGGAPHRHPDRRAVAPKGRDADKGFRGQPSDVHVLNLLLQRSVQATSPPGAAGVGCTGLPCRNLALTLARAGQWHRCRAALKGSDHRPGMLSWWPGRSGTPRRLTPAGVQPLWWAGRPASGDVKAGPKVREDMAAVQELPPSLPLPAHRLIAEPDLSISGRPRGGAGCVEGPAA
jgi:hypothetical protein